MASNRPAAHTPTEIITSTSAAAVLSFLKQSALDPEWRLSHLARVLGVNAGTAKRVAAELDIAGYIEPVPRKRDTWRNTTSGNVVAGVRRARLTRETAEKSVSEFLNRVREMNSNDRSPVRIAKAIAYGGYTTRHDRIQDVEIAVQLESKRGEPLAPAAMAEALRFLKGRGRALKVAPMAGWINTAPGLVLFSATR